MNRPTHNYHGDEIGASLSCGDADRREQREQRRDMIEANETMSFDELKDLGIPRLTVTRLRSCNLHTHELAQRLAHLGVRVGI